MREKFTDEEKIGILAISLIAAIKVFEALKMDTPEDNAINQKFIKTLNLALRLAENA